MSPIDPALQIRSVALAVSDLPRSADFYERVLGLALIGEDEHEALLGPDPGRPALVLSDLAAPTPLPPGATGLYHVAWLHPSSIAFMSRMVTNAGVHRPVDKVKPGHQGQ